MDETDRIINPETLVGSKDEVGKTIELPESPKKQSIENAISYDFKSDRTEIESSNEQTACVEFKDKLTAAVAAELTKENVPVTETDEAIVEMVLDDQVERVELTFVVESEPESNKTIENSVEDVLVRLKQLVFSRLSNIFTRFKLQIVYCLLLCGVIIYASIGGILLYELEHTENKEAEQIISKTLMECSLRFLNNSEMAPILVDTCFAPCNTITSWNRVQGIVFAYASMITLGYGPVTLMTTGGRIFYIFYCVIGTPVGLMFLVSVGKLMEKGVGYIVERVRRYWNKRKNQKLDEKKEFELGGLLFLIIFFSYIATGVFILCFFDTYNFIDGLFLNFLSLTAMDGTGYFDAKGILLLLGLVYVTGGLALVTLAIAAMGKHLYCLQGIGSKLEGTPMKKVWFCDKDMNVNDVIHMVTDELGLDRSQVDNLDLDKLIEKKLQKNQFVPE